MFREQDVMDKDVQETDKKEALVKRIGRLLGFRAMTGEKVRRLFAQRDEKAIYRNPLIRRTQTCSGIQQVPQREIDQFAADISSKRDQFFDSAFAGALDHNGQAFAVSDWFKENPRAKELQPQRLRLLSATRSPYFADPKEQAEALARDLRNNLIHSDTYHLTMREESLEIEIKIDLSAHISVCRRRSSSLIQVKAQFLEVLGQPCDRLAMEQILVLREVIDDYLISVNGMLFMQYREQHDKNFNQRHTYPQCISKITIDHLGIEVIDPDKVVYFKESERNVVDPWVDLTAAHGTSLPLDLVYQYAVTVPAPIRSLHTRELVRVCHKGKQAGDKAINTLGGALREGVKRWNTYHLNWERQTAKSKQQEMMDVKASAHDLMSKLGAANEHGFVWNRFFHADKNVRMHGLDFTWIKLLDKNPCPILNDGQVENKIPHAVVHVVGAYAQVLSGKRRAGQSTQTQAQNLSTIGTRKLVELHRDYK